MPLQRRGFVISQENSENAPKRLLSHSSRSNFRAVVPTKTPKRLDQHLRKPLSALWNLRNTSFDHGMNKITHLRLPISLIQSRKLQYEEHINQKLTWDHRETSSRGLRKYINSKDIVRVSKQKKANDRPHLRITSMLNLLEKKSYSTQITEKSESSIAQSKDLVVMCRSALSNFGTFVRVTQSDGYDTIDRIISMRRISCNELFVTATSQTQEYTSIYPLVLHYLFPLTADDFKSLQSYLDTSQSPMKVAYNSMRTLTIYDGIKWCTNWRFVHNK